MKFVATVLLALAVVQPQGVIGDLLDLLDAISRSEVQPAPISTEYRREYFGPAWADVDGNGCDTRNDILARDLDEVVVASNGCTVLSGVLTSDPYTGKTVRFTRGARSSMKVPVDHVVPLKWAWEHGADEWTNEEREAFANDPLNLVATTREANSAKSASGPDEWLPDVDREGYIDRFCEVATTYHLEGGCVK